MSIVLHSTDLKNRVTLFGDDLKIIKSSFGYNLGGSGLRGRGESGGSSNRGDKGEKRKLHDEY